MRYRFSLKMLERAAKEGIPFVAQVGEDYVGDDLVIFEEDELDEFFEPSEEEIAAYNPSPEISKFMEDPEALRKLLGISDSCEADHLAAVKKEGI